MMTDQQWHPADSPPQDRRSVLVANLWWPYVVDSIDAPLSEASENAEGMPRISEGYYDADRGWSVYGSDDYVVVAWMYRPENPPLSMWFGKPPCEHANKCLAWKRWEKGKQS